MRIRETTRRLRPAAWLVLILLLIAASVTWRHLGAPDEAGSGGHPGSRRIPVIAGIAARRDLPVWLSGIGTVTPLNAVDVKVRIDGALSRTEFTEGEEVEAGQLLAQIDPRPYQASLAQAAAIRQRDLAQFANAQQEVARAGKLARAGAGTSQSLDSMKAQQAALQATLEFDQASIDAARLNLEFTRITAPLAGRAGMRQVDAGSIVHANDAAGLVTITQMTPIAVLFALPQDELAEIIEGQRHGPLAVSIESRDGARHLADGTLVFINSTIDPGNGEIQMKAVFANDNRVLWPGEFVTARVRARIDHGATIVASQAVQTGAAGFYVYGLDAADRVHALPVTILASAEGVSEIGQGLAPGTRIVLDGQSRLKPGSQVAILAAPSDGETAQR